MNRLHVFVLAGAMLLPATLRAQYRDDEWRERNQRRAARSAQMAAQITLLVSDCEERTDTFRTALARALERSPLEGSRREDELNDDARKLARAMDRLRDSWNGDHDVNRSRRHVRSAISAGQDIHRTMMRHRLRESLQDQWDVVRRELNRLAEAFDEPKIRWDR